MNTKQVKFIHNDSTYHDLSMNSDIFNSIDRTITIFGKKKMLHRLEYYCYDSEYLQDMVTKNYTVHLDIAYRSKTEQLLRNIFLLENVVEQWMNECCNENLLFGWSFMNNRFLLTITNKLKLSSILIVLVIYIFVFLYFYYYGFMNSPLEYLKSIVVNHYEFSKIMLKLMLSNDHWIEKTALVFTIIYVAYYLYAMYQSIDTCYSHYNACSSFYEEYEQIRQYVQNVNAMVQLDIYNKNDDVIESLEYLKYYFSFENENEDQGENDCNVSLGFSLVSKLNVDDYINHMNIITNYVGRIDCFMSILKLIDEGDYTIPYFKDSNFPILHIDGVWHPLINKDFRVKNSFNIDVLRPNVMIVNGPNKAGKSTYMRSIISSVYLAQSLGICCCDRMILTPFRFIKTYMNIPDCVGRESLFEAELNRCYDYICDTESLKGFSLGIIDELFTGTNSLEGEAATYAILNRIANNATNITIMSTHYYDILPKLNNDFFIFCRFNAKKNKNTDKYTFDYKLVQDDCLDSSMESNQCIALELLKEKGFDTEIIESALSFILNKK
jgi:hypothetical protein